MWSHYLNYLLTHSLFCYCSFIHSFFHQVFIEQYDVPFVWDSLILTSDLQVSPKISPHGSFPQSMPLQTRQEVLSSIASNLPTTYHSLVKMAWLFLKSSLIIFPQVMASTMRDNIRLYFHVDRQHLVPY